MERDFYFPESGLFLPGPFADGIALELHAVFFRFEHDTVGKHRFFFRRSVTEVGLCRLYVLGIRHREFPLFGYPEIGTAQFFPLCGIQVEVGPFI